MPCFLLFTPVTCTHVQLLFDLFHLLLYTSTRLSVPSAFLLFFTRKTDVHVCIDCCHYLVAHQERVSGRDARRRFDPDGRSPYAYVNVLLYTQQLGAAVAFLNWKGHHFTVRKEGRKEGRNHV